LKTFSVLSLGSLLHLLLDPIQIKWANGVHLFAPFSWELINYGVFWPESFITYILSISGLIFFFLNWKNIKDASLPIVFRLKKFIQFSIMMMVYFATPIFFIEDVETADNHFVSTLRNFHQRTGKYIEKDRKKIFFNELTQSYWIESFGDDYIELKGVNDLESSKLSIQGTFITNNIINVHNYHENWGVFRDGASYVGLLLLALVWVLVQILVFIIIITLQIIIFKKTMSNIVFQ